MDGLSLDDGVPPVGQLPVEILTRVFAHLLERPGGPGDRSSIFASRVCRHWRAVALNFKEMWTIITDKQCLDWIKVMLERSDPAPLRLWLTRESNSNLEFHDKARLMLAELHRVKEMNLTFHRVCPSNDPHLHMLAKREMLTLIDKYPAPLLKFLTISMQDLAHGKKRLSPSLFAGVTPFKLHHLQLKNCIVPGSFHLLMAPLTYLELYCCGGWATVDQFLDMLAQLATLQSFIFHADGTTRRIRTLTTVRNDHSVVLPNLSRLDLYDDIIIVANILRYLSLTPNVSMTIQGEGQGTSNETPQVIAGVLDIGLRPTFASAFSQGGNFGVCAIQLLEGYDEKGLTITMTNPEDKNGKPDPDSMLPPRFEFSIRGVERIDPERCIPIAKMLARLPGLTDPKTIVAEHTNVMTKGAHWRDVAGAWKNVNTITLAGPAVYGFAEALGDENAPTLSPHLAIVTIKDVNLDTDRPGSDSDEEELRIPVIDALAAAIARRMARGCPPVAFTINECNVTPKRVEELKQAVEGGLVVFWDGQTKAWSEKEEKRRRETRDHAANVQAGLADQLPVLEEVESDDDDDDEDEDEDDQDWEEDQDWEDEQEWEEEE